jgi:hypothetical protein
MGLMPSVEVPDTSNSHVVPSFGTVSWLLGLPDVMYGFQARAKKHLLPSLRHWTDGWGDLSNAQQTYRVVREMYEKHCIGPEVFGNTITFPTDDVSVVGQKPSILHGMLRSPLHAVLPAEGAEVPFQVVLPDGEPWAVVIICAGTGDEAFFFRRKALAEPLLAHGVACILPTMPFYGPRRRHGQKFFFLKTFEDLMLQCYAGCCENIALMDWARIRYPQALLGIIGMSHGAGAAVATANYAHHDLAVVPLLLPTSPAVLATGSLLHDLALDALGAGGQMGQPSHEEVLDVVVHTLEQAIGPDAGGEVTPPTLGTYKRCVACASAAHDGMVTPEWSRKAMRKVKESLDPDARHYWVPGGHISSFIGARWGMIKIIMKSLHRLDKVRNGGAMVVSRL